MKAFAGFVVRRGLINCGNGLVGQIVCWFIGRDGLCGSAQAMSWRNICAALETIKVVEYDLDEARIRPDHADPQKGQKLKPSSNQRVRHTPGAEYPQLGRGPSCGRRATRPFRQERSPRHDISSQRIQELAACDSFELGGKTTP